MDSFLEWDDSLTVGVKEIDNQHKKLIKIIADLYDGVATSKKDILKTTLESILDYTQYHFKYEEDLFEKLGYPETDKHKKQHQKLIIEANSIMKELDQGKMVLVTDIGKVLRNWLMDHINGEDKKYTKFFHENGIK